MSHATIAKYGVGSCGPRGFYGTIDVHLQLEEHLASFMGFQRCIIYAYDMACVSSLIPSISNRMDVIVADEVGRLRRGIIVADEVGRWRGIIVADEVGRWRGIHGREGGGRF